MKGKRGKCWEKNAKKQHYGNHIDESQTLSYYYIDAGDLITQPFTVFFYYTKTKFLNKFTDFFGREPYRSSDVSSDGTQNSSYRIWKATIIAR